MKQKLHKLLEYCQQANGLPYCKNCGLSEEIIDEVIEGQEDEAIYWQKTIKKELDDQKQRSDDHFASVCADIQENIYSVLNMVEGGTDRKKIAQFIKEYLLD